MGLLAKKSICLMGLLNRNMPYGPTYKENYMPYGPTLQNENYIALWAYSIEICLYGPYLQRKLFCCPMSLCV